MQFSDLVGLTLVSIERDDSREDGDVLILKTNDRTFKMYHEHDCCESVVIEDINGEFADMIGTPITVAEEGSNSNHADQGDNSSTWTFYHLGTNKGRLTIRWHGSSNGYYSESVSFVEVEARTSDTP